MTLRELFSSLRKSARHQTGPRGIAGWHCAAIAGSIREGQGHVVDEDSYSGERRSSISIRPEEIPMKRIKDKYRGKTVHFHVMAELVLNIGD